VTYLIIDFNCRRESCPWSTKEKRRNLGNRDWEGRIWGFGYWVWNL